jgi:hypothetical protein
MFTVRDFALISAFAALYLVYGAISGVSLRAITLSQDLLFLIAALFAILAIVVRQAWSATLLGTITGLVFLGTPGAPFPLHITASLIANGLVFDTYLRLMNRRTTPPTRWNIVTAATLGNLVMAVVGLSALQAVGSTWPYYVWAGFVLIGGLMGTVGASFGLTVVRRIRVSTTAPGRIRVEPSLVRA